jgi:hypothetical protein
MQHSHSPENKKAILSQLYAVRDIMEELLEDLMERDGVYSKVIDVLSLSEDDIVISNELVEKLGISWEVILPYVAARELEDRCIDKLGWACFGGVTKAEQSF